MPEILAAADGEQSSSIEQRSKAILSIPYSKVKGQGGFVPCSSDSASGSFESTPLLLQHKRCAAQVQGRSSLAKPWTAAQHGHRIQNNEEPDLRSRGV